SLELLISSEGWQPITFASAREFLSHEPILGPSCVVLDVALPDLNGLDLQERIAGNRVGMPIIFITAYADVPMTVRAMKAGAVEFLTKPFSHEVLLDAIRGAIERSRAEHACAAGFVGNIIERSGADERLSSMNADLRHEQNLAAIGLQVGGL